MQRLADQQTTSAELPAYDVLNEKEYAEFYATCLKNTDQYLEMRPVMQPVIDSFNDKEISLLSIGAGSGEIEDSFVKNLGMKLSYFCGIEPNEVHHRKLEKTVAEWNVKYTIEAGYFTPDYATDESFDLVLMAHCLYCMDDPVNTVLKARSLLKPNGKLVVIIHTKKGACELYEGLLQFARFSSTPISDQSVASENISYVLSKDGVSHEITLFPTLIDVTDFIEERPTPTAKHVVSFFLQTKFDGLQRNHQSKIRQIVRECAVTDNDGRHWLDNPTAFMLIQ